MFLWYVINTYSGHENKVKTNLEHRIVSLNQAPAFRRVVVPTEQVIETKDGQKVQTEKRVLPGYVLVDVNLSDESWTVVKGTPGVTGFVCLPSVHLDGATARGENAKSRARAERTNQLQLISDKLRLRLGIMERVHVTLVDHNPLVMSVETLATRTGPFVISIDRDFIRELNRRRNRSRDCARARARVDLHAPPVRADGASRQRHRACASSAARRFEPVYEKVWERTGIKGNLIEFIGRLRSSSTRASSPSAHYCCAAAGFGAFPNTSTIVAVTVPVFLNVCITPPLRSIDVAGLHVDGRLSFDGQRQLTGQQREHVIGRVGVIVHAAHRAGLGPVAQHAEVRPVHHHHRRDAGIAGDRTALFGTADGLRACCGRKDAE